MPLLYLLVTLNRHVGVESTMEVTILPLALEVTCSLSWFRLLGVYLGKQDRSAKCEHHWDLPV